MDRIRTNVIVNIVRTLVLTFLSFITFPWVCRYLGDQAVGTYTWCNTFVNYFLILAKIGIPNLAVRECVKVRDNKEALSNKAQAFFLLQLIATILSFGSMCSLALTVPALKESNSLIFLLSLNFLSGVFSFEWIFISLEKQFYMSVRSIVCLALSSILTICFIQTPSDVYIYALITILVTVTTTICNLYYVRKHISFKKTMPYNLKQYAKPLLVLCLISFGISLYNQTDTFILGFLDPSKSEVASYSVGIKGIDIIIGVITALSTVFIPRSAYLYQQEDKSYFNRLTKYSINICLFIVLPAIVTMCVLAKPICGLISGTYDYSKTDVGYYNAPYVLMILATMMLTYSLGDIIYGQVLLPMKKERYYLVVMLSGTVANAILSIILGKYVFSNNPALGVALGTALTDLVIIIILLGKTWAWTKNAIFNKNTLKLIAGNAIVAISSLTIHYLFEKTSILNAIDGASKFVIEMVSVVFLGAILYILFLSIVKEDLVYSFIKKVQRTL